MADPVNGYYDDAGTITQLTTDNMGLSSAYPVSYLDKTAQYQAVPFPEIAMTLDCCFYQNLTIPHITDVKVVGCEDSDYKAIFKKPHTYVNGVMEALTRCEEDTCHSMGVTVEAPEVFKLADKQYAIEYCEQDCMMQGCGTNPELSWELFGLEAFRRQAMEQQSTLIDMLFMRYIFDPCADNLAIADITGYTKAEEFDVCVGGAEGTVDGAVDYKKLGQTTAAGDDGLNIVQTKLENALCAPGYNDEIKPQVLDAAYWAENIDCPNECLDADYLWAILAHLEQINADTFGYNSLTGSKFKIFVNPADFPRTILRNAHLCASLGTVNAEKHMFGEFAYDGRDSNGLDYYDFAGHQLVMSRLIPKGRALVIPMEVLEYIYFAKSPMTEKVNGSAGCDFGKVFIKWTWKMGWYIPECYRDKYFIVELPAACCGPKTCVGEPAPAAEEKAAVKTAAKTETK